MSSAPRPVWTRRDVLRRSTTATAAVLGGPHTLAGCADEDASVTFKEARRTGKIKVGFADEAPYGFLADDGRLTGQAPEVARVVLRPLGIDAIEGVLSDFAQLIPGLKAQRYAFVAAGMFITPARCAEVAFSIPDYQVESAFLVQAGNPAGINRFEDVRDADVLIGTLTGAVELSYALAAGVPEEKIITLSDQDSLFRAVQSGRVYGAAMLDTTAAYLLQEHPGSGLEQTAPFPGSGNRPGIGGFAFRRGDDQFVNAFNMQLREVKRSGAWRRIVADFGFGSAHEPPSEIPTQTLCGG